MQIAAINVISFAKCNNEMKYFGEIKCYTECQKLCRMLEHLACIGKRKEFPVVDGRCLACMYMCIYVCMYIYMSLCVNLCLCACMWYVSVHALCQCVGEKSEASGIMHDFAVSRFIFTWNCLYHLLLP